MISNGVIANTVEDKCIAYDTIEYIFFIVLHNLRKSIIHRNAIFKFSFCSAAAYHSTVN